jgi:hypothetical protein
VVASVSFVKYSVHIIIIVRINGRLPSFWFLVWVEKKKSFFFSCSSYSYFMSRACYAARAKEKETKKEVVIGRKQSFLTKTDEQMHHNDENSTRTVQ